MTIQEAIRSGKKYKRQIFQIWRCPNENHTFTIPDILADDWEIEREPREIFVLEADGRVYQISEYNPENLVSCGADKVVKFREVIE